MWGINLDLHDILLLQIWDGVDLEFISGMYSKMGTGLIFAQCALAILLQLPLLCSQKPVSLI